MVICEEHSPLFTSDAPCIFDDSTGGCLTHVLEAPLQITGTVFQNVGTDLTGI